MKIVGHFCGGPGTMKMAVAAATRKRGWCGTQAGTQTST